MYIEGRNAWGSGKANDSQEVQMVAVKGQLMMKEYLKAAEDIPPFTRPFSPFFLVIWKSMIDGSKFEMAISLVETCGRGNGAEGLPNKDKQITGHEIANYYFNSQTLTNLTLQRLALLSPNKDPAGTLDNIHINQFEPSLTGLLSFAVSEHSVMHQDARNTPLALPKLSTEPSSNGAASSSQEPLVWDWPAEHEDRQKERKADAALHGCTPFEVDRKLLKDVVREKMGVDVGRITFLSAGTFHKAYLVTLVDHVKLVARVARRFMPRLKTESEVATVHYLRHKTNIPVSTIYHYDSNPYNRLGGEFIMMSKAPGIPLAQIYHGLPYNDLVKLVKNLAVLIIPLFAHRFVSIGSLYFGPDPRLNVTSGTPTPKATPDHYSAYPFSPTLEMAGPPAMSRAASSSSLFSLKPISREYHVGPIISWPFFGSNRGELAHPVELNRGPWPTTEQYLASCVTREIQGVVRENEGKAAPHRLHLDPDEIISSRHHRLRAVPGDESDESDEWNLAESEDEWEGPGDAMYRDYRRMQRSTFLVAHMSQREEAVKREMGRWQKMMARLGTLLKKGDGPEEFGLDCHDLSLENIFVDEKDNTSITCIIDWESTTTRPLWACAHVPAFLQSSPFLTKVFREVVASLPTDPTVSIKLPKTDKPIDLATLCKEWLYYESAGTRLRLAHRCAEWDGWEEGLVESILGPEEFENEWFKVGKSTADSTSSTRAMVSSPGAEHHQEGEGAAGSRERNHAFAAAIRPGRGVKLSSKLPILQEQEKEQMLNTTGDICGGRGGELGRRLEAWLTVSGNHLEDIAEKVETENTPVDVEAR